MATKQGLKVLVGVKRVVDYAVKVRVAPNKLGVEIQNVKMSMNPFDEIAIEQAVRLKEQGLASEVIALSIGPAKSTEVLRTALAMGATSAIHIPTPEKLRPDQDLQPLLISKIFSNLIKNTFKNEIDLLLLGKQSIDSDNGLVAPMISGMLNWPVATCASKIMFNKEKVKENVEIIREVDGGTEHLNFSTLPAVISVDLRLCEPRYTTLPNIMKARKMPIKVIKPEEILGGNIPESTLKIVSVTEPQPRKAGVILKEGVDELIPLLKKQGFI